MHPRLLFWTLLLLLTVTGILCQSQADISDPSTYDPCECPNQDIAAYCECVYIRNCNASGYVFTGTERINWRADVPIREKCKPSEICCIVPEDDETISTTVKSESTTTTSVSTTEPPVEEKSTTVSEVTTPGTIPPPTIKTKSGCGIRGKSVNKELSSDKYSTFFGEFPWMVAVLNYTRGQKVVLNCAGTLISHEVVLTAAHCVSSHAESDVGVYAGLRDLTDSGNPSPKEIRFVKKIIRHEDFDPWRLTNDVALLVLRKALPETPHIGTICLPEQDAKFYGKRCVATGWGKKTREINTDSGALTQVDLPVLERQDCRNMLRKTYLGRYFRLDKSFVCAGGEGEGICNLDGGGPLMCQSDKDPDRFYQAGIIAGGIECSLKDVPDLYADVPYFVEWIKKKLDENSLVNGAVHP